VCVCVCVCVCVSSFLKTNCKYFFIDFSICVVCYLLRISSVSHLMVDCVWNVMAHCDARVEKWRRNKRLEWVTSKRHMTAELRLARAVQTLQVDVHSSSASSRLNWRPRRLKWTRPFRRKTKSGFSACAITFQTQSTLSWDSGTVWVTVAPYTQRSLPSTLNLTRLNKQGRSNRKLWFHLQAFCSSLSRSTNNPDWSNQSFSWAHKAE